VLRLGLKVVAGLVVAVLVYLAVTAVQVWLMSRRDEARPAQAIVVMGAAQYDGVPSPDLASRLAHALSLWRARLAPRVVVTGGGEPGDRYTEAEAAAAYLERRGVSKHDVEEVGGRTSWESLSDAASMLHGQGVNQVLLVSDPFHSARISDIAGSLGLTGYPSPTKTSPIQGFATVPYFAKETVGVALGRVIGFGHLSDMHSALELGPVFALAGVG
jgi:uncharacterized SAM-binding protein YcdF (DUF218 family)